MDISQWLASEAAVRGTAAVNIRTDSAARTESGADSQMWT
jgi:hypothetical protein